MSTDSTSNSNPSASSDPIQSEQTQVQIQIMHRAIGLLSAINRPSQFLRAAMTFCNELATQWGCERVSIGVLKGRCVQLKATSHCEHFSRKMELIQDIESAMEECLDQDTEITYPELPENFTMNKAVMQLAQKHGPNSILCVPLHLDDQCEAVVVLERPQETPFDLSTVNAIGLACNLCSSRLLNLYHQDRWFGARWAHQLRRAIGWVLGVQHTWIKLTVLVLLGFILFIFLVKGQYRCKGSCLIEAIVQQSVCAPFDGFIKDIKVEVGDLVTLDHPMLGELDTAELRLQLAAAKAELGGYLKQVDAYMRDAKTAQAQIAQADADKVQAEIDLLEHMIGQAQLQTPVHGVVVTGDLKRQVGAPVKTGDILFEVAPLADLRAQVMVPEDQILDIQMGQPGRLATVSYPEDRISFVVERISPMAEVINNRNVFRVQVKLNETRDWMRPGMEGIAKIDIDKRRYAWIWTRKLVNWIRMVIWF